MKGIVLAGGLGTRLLPLTRVTNKHLLPVYDRPMIYYPIQKLVEAGIDDILVVTGGEHAGEFLRLMGNGRAFGLKHLNYTYQEGEGGIAEALGLAEHWADSEPVVVILGDNLFEDTLVEAVQRFRHQGSGAKILLKEVGDPERFGVAVLEDTEAAAGTASGDTPAPAGGRVARIVEKPEDPPSRLAVTGVYMYDSRVFDIIRTLEPSARDELEITDVNNRYIEWSELTCEVLDGWWTDAGTFDSLYRASRLVREAQRVGAPAGV